MSDMGWGLILLISLGIMANLEGDWFLLGCFQFIIVLGLTFFALRKNADRKKQDAKEQHQARRRLLEHEPSRMKVWDPTPWSDTSKIIFKVKTELWGEYDQIHERWQNGNLEIKIFVEGNRYTFAVSKKVWNEIVSQSTQEAILFGNTNYKDQTLQFYLYADSWYFSRESISAEDAQNIIDYTEESRKRRVDLALQRAHGITDSRPSGREPIPIDVQVLVWNRDGGKCVNCGSNINLEFDHIIPISKGGSNTARNIQLLCEKCNREKGAKIGA